MQLLGVRIVGTIIGLVIGIVTLHIEIIGKWIGLFVMVGVLGELFSPIMKKNGIASALAIFALLFAGVYTAIPYLIHIGPHHWMPKL